MDIGYAGAFLGGILTLLSPCSVMLLPAFFAYAFTSPRVLVGRTAVFYAGLASTPGPMGVFSGSLGSLVVTNRSTLVLVAASPVIVLGLWQLSGLPFPGFSRSDTGDADPTSIAAVFTLGAVYAVAGVCAGPILGSVLMVAALGGNALYGGMMLALYAWGMTVPLFVLALVWKRLGARVFSWLRPRTIAIGPWQNTWTMVVSGGLSVAIGVLLIVTDGTASLGGAFTISTQYTAETKLSAWSSRVPDLLVVAVAAASLGAAMGWRRHRAHWRNRAVAER